MALVPPIEYEAAAPAVRAVYDDIRATRNTDYINNGGNINWLGDCGPIDGGGNASDGGQMRAGKSFRSSSATAAIPPGW